MGAAGVLDFTELSSNFGLDFRVREEHGGDHHVLDQNPKPISKLDFLNFIFIVCFQMICQGLRYHWSIYLESVAW